ncbi:MAG: STM4014 family protein, partial [Thermoleophilia bacterium]|nr:STM4014 family protein [Mycobacteriaceae bacterium]MBY0398006.1 STM4014 family protein [Thermoleophilia bacterium]
AALAVGPGRVQVQTTVEVEGQGDDLRLYNTRAIRRIASEPEAARLIDALCRERAQAERWIPKASIDGGPFDLRVVVIAGRATHIVVRVGRSPMTNLHLLNRRGDPEAVRRRMDPADWDAAMASCERAAGSFPDSLYAGVDLAIAAGFRRHAVLEINAFGDLLPGVVDGDGRSTHAAELDAAGVGRDA